MKKLLFLILFSVVLLSAVAPAEYNNFVILQSEPIYYLDMRDINQLLIKHNIHHRNIVRAQIMLETSYLSSELCKVNKNLVGMKHPKRRETMSVQSNLGHALYKSYSDCVKDISIYQRLFYIPGEDYFIFLQRIGYAQDPQYIEKLKSLLI
jgi:hypothetical protein